MSCPALLNVCNLEFRLSGFGFELESIRNFEGEVAYWGARSLIYRRSIMARVNDNWERLVRATLKREQLRNAGQGHGRTPSGIVGAVPPSLGKTTNIDAILQAADEIQAEDSTVARICTHFVSHPRLYFSFSELYYGR